MNYRVIHRTVFVYDTEVTVAHHLVRLTPLDSPGQRCLEHELIVDPSPSQAHSYVDYFGNRATLVALEQAHRRLSFEARSLIQLLPPHALPDAPALSYADALDRFGRGDDPKTAEATEYRLHSPLIQHRPDYARYARDSFSPRRPLVEAVRELTTRIHGDFTFDPHATHVSTPIEQAFADRRGVCQDFAQIQIACLRSLGIPARYVSGYLETLPPPGQPKLVGADASHAWVSFFCPGAGWLEVDPTNDLVPSDRHLVVAYGRDFGDVSPTRGVIVGGGRHTLSVGVDVTRCADSAPA